MRFHLTSTSIDDELKSDFSDDISKIVADYVDIATMCSAKDVGYGSYPMGGEQYPILVNVNEDGILCLTVYNSYIE